MAEPPDSGQVVSASSPELSTPPLGHVAPLGMFVSAKFQPLGARSLRVLQLLRVPDQPRVDSLQPELLSASASMPMQAQSEPSRSTQARSIQSRLDDEAIAAPADFSSPELASSSIASSIQASSAQESSLQASPAALTISPVAQLTIAQPTIAQSPVSQPVSAQPTINQPALSQPAIAQSSLSQSTIAQPTINQLDVPAVQAQLEQPGLDQLSLGRSPIETAATVSTEDSIAAEDSPIFVQNSVVQAKAIESSSISSVDPPSIPTQSKATTEFLPVSSNGLADLPIQAGAIESQAVSDQAVSSATSDLSVQAKPAISAASFTSASDTLAQADAAQVDAVQAQVSQPNEIQSSLLQSGVIQAERGDRSTFSNSSPDTHQAKVAGVQPPHSQRAQIQRQSGDRAIEQLSDRASIDLGDRQTLVQFRENTGESKSFTRVDSSKIITQADSVQAISTDTEFVLAQQKSTNEIDTPSEAIISSASAPSIQLDSVAPIAANPLVNPNTSEAVIAQSQDSSIATSNLPIQLKPETNIQPDLKVAAIAMPDLPIQSKAEADIQTKLDIAAIAAPDLPIQSKSEVGIQSKPEINAIATSELLIQSKPELNIQEKPEVTSAATSEVAVQANSEADTYAKSNTSVIAIQPASDDPTVAQLLAAGTLPEVPRVLNPLVRGDVSLVQPMRQAIAPAPAQPASQPTFLQKALDVSGDRVVPSAPSLISRSPNPPDSWTSIAQLMGEDQPATVQPLAERPFTVQQLSADGSGSVSETSTEQMISSETIQIEKNQTREVQAKEAIASELPLDSFPDSFPNSFPDQLFQLRQLDFFQRDKDLHEMGRQIEYSSASDRELLVALSTRLEDGDAEFLADLVEVMQIAQDELSGGDRLSPELLDNHALDNDVSEILEQLAQEMYQALQHRLVLERERQGNLYSGRLPW